jgi:uncharacterized protein (DUF1330 family)
MITLLVSLTISDFGLFEEFETEAAAIMADYGGEIVQAVELEHHADNSGEELHLVTFPDQHAFSSYRADRRLKALATLRERAISATSVRTVLRNKTYTA